ncbi:hypothetical protein ACS49_03965 [Bacillus cereus]|nr:hypothetical protein ACS49_03965 [Bacillus cereus]
MLFEMVSVHLLDENNCLMKIQVAADGLGQIVCQRWEVCNLTLAFQKSQVEKNTALDDTLCAEFRNVSFKSQQLHLVS